MLNPMLNEEFLLQLEQNRNREIYARITLLNINEMPVDYIEGKVASGSINIDGQSVIRRSCSLSLIADKININDFYWGLKSKFILEIGIKNTIDTKKYDSIIWFKQGIYVINTFNVALSVNNYIINISGKDKMCLLNGDLAGNIMNISEDFGTKWFWQDDAHIEYTSEDIPIKEIIYRGVQTYAGELPHNIIINDIDECGVELLNYRGNTPLYLIKNYKDKIYENMTINGDMNCWFKQKNITIKSTLKNIENDGGKYETEISSEINQASMPSIVFFDEDNCNSNNLDFAYMIYKVVSGLAVGYRLTDLTYAGELIANAGDAFTSVLDKIVKMLGNFEYFYDLDGHFVFQRKHNYIYGNWTGLANSTTDTESTIYVKDNVNNKTFSYKFDDNYFITSFTNTPSFTNVKNDFSAWGKRKTSYGSEIPVHMRCAIDIKPEFYRSYNNQIYLANNKIIEKIDNENNSFIDLEKVKIVDWREIIYQMALDYFSNNNDDDFNINIRKNNTLFFNGVLTSLYPSGKTGYERYYTDMEAFWRTLYCPIEEGKTNGLYDQGFAPWNPLVSSNPELLDFWIDFLDPVDNNLEKYSVQQIGPRPKVINEDSIKAIYYRETPNVLFEEIEEKDNKFSHQPGYTYIKINSSQKNLFNMSSQGVSSKDRIEQLLNQFTYAAETVTISGVPIYRLDVNTRVSVKDVETNIAGEYVIKKINIPLNYNGTMNITADKAIKLIY